MGFKKGIDSILRSESCQACVRGVHSACGYVRELDEINHGVFADETAGNMIYLRPSCGCFLVDEERHYYKERDENEAMDSVHNGGNDVEPDVEPDVSALWDVVYRPYPALLAREGFDSIMSMIEEGMENKPWLESRWGDILISGELEKVIILAVDEGQRPGDVGPQDFQTDVATWMADIGLEGHLLVQRSVHVVRLPEFFEDEDDDE